MEEKHHVNWDAVIDECKWKGLNDVMGFKYDYYVQVISQFYATLWFQKDHNQTCTR